MGRGATETPRAVESAQIRAGADSRRIRREAEIFAAPAIAAGAEGVALFGSAARGTAGPDSDMDLLFVFDEAIPKLSTIEFPDVDGSPEPVFTKWDRIESPRQRYVFFKIIAAEALYLHDPSGRLRRTLESLPLPDAETLVAEAGELRSRVPGEREIALNGGPGQWLFADCYRWAKSAALQANVLRGEMIPGRAETLAALGARHPEIGEDLAWLEHISPFYLSSMRKGESSAHPFRPADHPEELERTISATAKVVEAAAAEIEELASLRNLYAALGSSR